MSSNNPMVSEVSICNQALTWLGERPISSLQDKNDTAEWMRNNYPFIRDAVLAERMWTWATARKKSETADRDAFGIQYQHDKPNDWIAVYRSYREVVGNDPSRWLRSRGFRVEGDYVLTDEPVAYLWGLERVADTGKYHPMFVQALAARIAADAAIPLTENARLQADMWKLYDVKLREAAARDGQQGDNEEIISESLILARGRTF